MILTEYNDSRRIDRQLFGRSARQGDRGSGETIVALDDELFAAHAPLTARWLAGRAHADTGVLARMTAVLRWIAQSAAESHNRASRQMTLKYDRRLTKVLAFSGRGE